MLKHYLQFVFFCCILHRSSALVSSKYETMSSKFCKPGTSWREDCNTCYCDYPGVKRCTLRLCPIDIMRETGLDEGAVKIRTFIETNCGRDASWKKSCNYCSCSTTGTGAKLLCTRRACPFEPTCDPLSMRKIHCGECICELDGHFLCYQEECAV